MKKIAFVFPGQGSQKVGMGQDLFENNPLADTYFKQADAALSVDLKSIILEGPKERLTQTEYAQSAIFIVSALLLDQLKQNGITPTIVAGHSLGEITAYFAAGVLDFESALALIQARSQAMKTAYESEKSAMTAVIGLPLDTVQALVAPYKDEPVVIANINSPQQVVISGQKESVETLHAAIKEAGGKPIPLPVSGAFHSPLMAPAKTALQNHVGDLTFQDAVCPIVLNRNAEPETKGPALKTNIPEQVISSVQWVKTIQYLKTQVDTIYECGPSSVLTGLIKKIDPSIQTQNIASLQDIPTQPPV